MTKFGFQENELICSDCEKCKKLVWPPNDYCNRCFGEVIWRPISQIGKLIEFSKKDETMFCLVEFEDDIRIMGSLDGTNTPVIGQSIKIIKCEDHGNLEFVFRM